MKKTIQFLSVFFLMASLSVNAQFMPIPSAVQQTTGLNGPITAMTVYDGKLVIGGTFTDADGHPCNGLVTWDGTSFDTLPGTPTFIESTNSANRIYTLQQSENSLYVGGSFQNIKTGTVIENFGNMARYNGLGWSRLVSTPSTLYGATNGPVKCLVFHEGKLYVGGDFSMVDVNAGLPAGHLATYSWNSTPEWEAVGSSGLSGNSVSAEALTLWNERVLVAGRFEAADGIASRNMVIYDEAAGFISINTGMFTSQIGRARCLAIQDGKVYVGGDYNNIGQNNLFGLNAYDGTNWLNLNADIGIDRRALYACDKDYVWVGGHLEEFGAEVNNLFVYDVANDKALPFSDNFWGVDGIVNAMVEYDGELYIAGDFQHLQGKNGQADIPFNNIFKVSNFCGTSSGTNTESKSERIEFYPNPVSDMLYIISETNTDVRKMNIHDLIGQQLISANIVGEKTTIDISHLSSGVYFMTVQNGSKISTHKFVKQ
ncbi:MAG: T9SS type A sorting domain-containing protein [Saprospiraceae bacterium]|nr:T9SS type A sorting domain-containing protein [Saprospiraceae bacterium]